LRDTFLGRAHSLQVTLKTSAEPRYVQHEREGQHDPGNPGAISDRPG
jgi:hypothetical protein